MMLGPLLCHHGGGEGPLTRYQFTVVLDKAKRSTNLSLDRCSYYCISEVRVF